MKTEFTTAIIKVLTSGRKKDVKSEVKVIESKGYIVRKPSSSKSAFGLEVYNPETNKFIYLTSRYSYKEDRYVYNIHYSSYYNYGESSTFNTLEELENKFEFENYLNTKVNFEYRESEDYNYKASKSQKEYANFKSRKWRVEYHEQRIEEAKAELEKQIAKLQKENLYHTEQLAESKREFSEYKKQIGLR